MCGKRLSTCIFTTIQPRSQQPRRKLILRVASEYPAEGVHIPVAAFETAPRPQPSKHQAHVDAVGVGRERRALAVQQCGQLRSVETSSCTVALLFVGRDRGCVTPRQKKVAVATDRVFYTLFYKVRAMKLHAYADGSCFHNNGTRRPIGGIGVYVDEGHPENVGRSVREGRITNQNMELLAAHMALQAVAHMWQPGDSAVLYTDSIYVMNCMTKWIKLWELNGWTTKNKRPVQNGDVLRAMLPIVKRCSVTFERVPPYERGRCAAAVEDDDVGAPNGRGPDAGGPGDGGHVLGNRGAAMLAVQAATEGSRSGCYIKRGMCINSEDMLSGG